MPVFTNERGEAIRRAAWASVWENLGRVADKALLKQHEVAFNSWERRGRPDGAEPTLRQVPDDATMHDLRHFYASVLIKHQESVKTVQKRLGHAKPPITLNTYTHLWPDEEDTTRAAIEAVFDAVPSMCPPRSGMALGST
ncbi:tyrosine-type recombinase/integrase [Kitasatospora sp. NPDC001225]